MRCFALRVGLRLLQLLSPFFFVFHFFPLPTVLIADEGRNDTPEVPLYLHQLVWLAPCSMAALIVFQSSADSRIFALFARESTVSPSAR
jgi:hypothetical protein